METSTAMVNVFEYVQEVKRPEDEDSEFELLLETCALFVDRAVGRGRGRRRWIQEAGMERLPDEGVRIIFDAVAQGIRAVLYLNRNLHGARETGIYEGARRKLYLVPSEENSDERGGAS